MAGIAGTLVVVLSLLLIIAAAGASNGTELNGTANDTREQIVTVAEPGVTLTANGTEPGLTLTANGTEPGVTLTANGTEPGVTLTANGTEPGVTLTANGTVPGVMLTTETMKIPTEGASEVAPEIPVFSPDKGNFVPKKDVTPVNWTQVEEAGERFKAVHDPIRAAVVGDISLSQMSMPPVMDPGGVPHYYGPIPNYANSPMPRGPIAAITLDAGGSGYSINTTVIIYDVYYTNTTEADVDAVIADGIITGFTINDAGTNYTAPRVVIHDPDGTGTGAAASATITPDGVSGIRKFVHALPGLNASGQNELGQYIPVAIPDTTTFPPGGRGYTSAPTVVITDVNGTGATASATIAGDEVDSVTVDTGGSGYSDNPIVTFTGGGALTNAIGKATVVNGEITAITLVGCDYYVIELGEYTEQLHPDLPPTLLRGYRQTNTGDPTVSQFHYLGPLIVAQRDRPVRVRFENKLPAGAGGHLFIPVDKTVMGAGMGPLEMDVTAGYDINYSENRATIHLHGGITPWISDGTPHQWTVPADELTDYPRGVSVYNVPDMDNGGPNPPKGVLTFFYTNQQSARLLFYHDHAHGITRLNVYAGEAGGYVIQDQVEHDMINGTDITGVNPGGLQVLPDIGIPLVIQDKTFVDENTLAAQDPTWMAGSTLDGTPHTGDLWYPHVYMPVQNPADPSGMNAYGRWQYGPWFWPPTQVAFGPIPNPYFGENPWEYTEIPGTPNPSMAMEAFMDTSLVNGAVYPYLEVEPRAYRFRILSVADDRFYNLQFYVADPTIITADGRTHTEVKMVPADFNPSYPPEWPTDGRAGGVPDPLTRGPDWIQIGTEGGFLPKPVVVPIVPVNWNTDPTTFNAGNVNQHSLLLAPAERADVIVDFSDFAGQTLILYNDAPAAFPALDPHFDYYTGMPDLTEIGGTPGTYPGYGPNTRTVMQIRVGTEVNKPTPEVTLANLEAVFEKTAAKRGVFEVSQEPIIIPSAEYNSAYNDNFPVDTFVRIYQTSHTFMNLSHGMMTFPLQALAIQDEMGEAYDEFGRMSGFLGRQYRNPQGQQNLLLYGYESPPLEFLKDSKWANQIVTLNDGTQIWKITHNGVDTHPIHWHLVNVQLINHVAWDNAVRPPDQTELGWKDTFRIDPLEDTIFAVKAIVPSMPFEVPNSYRPLDPTMPLGVPMRSSPGGGTAWFDPTGQPVQVLNHIVNFGGEYVFHCHILAHEEMDMMHPLVAAVTPKAPSNLILTPNGSAFDLTWNDNSLDETGFTLQRAGDTAFTTGVVNFTVGMGVTKYTDSSIVPDQTYYYRVQANNVVGDTTVYPAPAVGFPTMSADSAWSNTAIPTVTPSITVMVPNGGEDWQQGSTNTLTWNYTGDPGATVRIELLKGTVVNLVINSSTPIGSGGSGSYIWTVPFNQALGTDYKIQISSTTNPVCTDTSNATFTISAGPPITVLVPNGGENWQQGSINTITWNYTGNPGSMVRIELLKGTAVNRVISSSAPIGSGGSGSYIWTVPFNQAVGTNYKIRITSTTNGVLTDTSNAFFTISAGPPITVTAPNGGENWPQGSANTITWNYTGNPGSTVRIELLKGTVVNLVISASRSIGTGGSGSHSWTVPFNQAPGTDYKIRITSTTNATNTDTSNANFTISAGPPITVTAPNGGESWARGIAYTIRWKYTGNPGSTVRIELLKGEVVNRVISASRSIGTGGTGSYSWTVPSTQALGTDYKIRITSTSNPAFTDSSNAVFTIRSGGSEG